MNAPEIIEKGRIVAVGPGGWFGSFFFSAHCNLEGIKALSVALDRSKLPAGESRWRVGIDPAPEGELIWVNVNLGHGIPLTNSAVYRLLRLSNPGVVGIAKILFVGAKLLEAQICRFVFEPCGIHQGVHRDSFFAERQR